MGTLHSRVLPRLVTRNRWGKELELSHRPKAFACLTVPPTPMSAVPHLGSCAKPFLTAAWLCTPHSHLERKVLQEAQETPFWPRSCSAGPPHPSPHARALPQEAPAAGSCHSLLNPQIPAVLPGVQTAAIWKASSRPAPPLWAHGLVGTCSWQ